jgi:hypothetical protein
MSDQEKKQQSTNISPEQDAENKKKQNTELGEEELKKVSGGGIVITKPTDVASTKN